MGTTVLIFFLLLNLSYDELTDAFGKFSQKRKKFEVESAFIRTDAIAYSLYVYLCVFSIFHLLKIDCKCCQSRGNCSRGYTILAVVKEVGRWVFPR